MASCHSLVGMIPNTHSLIHLVDLVNKEVEQDASAIEISIERGDLLKQQANYLSNEKSVRDADVEELQSSSAAETPVSPGDIDTGNRRKQLAPLKWCDTEKTDSDKGPGKNLNSHQSERYYETVQVSTAAAPHKRRQVAPLSRLRKSRPNEAERLFRSLNNLEKAALYIRNRPSPRSPADLLEAATVDQSKMNESVQKQQPAVTESGTSNELPRNTRSHSNVKNSVPAPSSLAWRRSKQAKRRKVAELEDTLPLAGGERLRSLRNRAPVAHVSQLPSDQSVSGLGSVNEASCTGTRSNGGIQSSVSSSKSTQSTSTSSYSQRRPRSSRKSAKKTLPKVSAFKSTFSFDDVFFGSHSDVQNTSKLPNSHYLHKWTINQYYPGKP